MKKVLITIVFATGIFIIPKLVFGATEFVSVVDTGGTGDYSSLSAWENSFGTIDLTANTFVFSGTTTGTLSDSVTVYQCRGGVYQNVFGTMTHDTTTQALVKGITGGASFQTNDIWYTNDTCNSANYYTISNAGDSPIAIAKCQATTGAADTVVVTIDGWTTSAASYIKIWTDPAESYRQQGRWDDKKFRLEVADSNIIQPNANYLRIDGLQIKVTGTANYRYGIYLANAVDHVEISNNIVTSAGGNYRNGIASYNAGVTNLRIWNNITYDFLGSNSKGIDTATADANAYVYNNTVVNCTEGIGTGYNDTIAKNNIIKSVVVSYSGTFAAGSDYNSASLADVMGIAGAGGINNKNNQTFTFLDETNDDFHLSSMDSAAKNSGTDLSADANLPFSTDIDGHERTETWDIGADEVQTFTIQSSDIGRGSDTNGLVLYQSFDGPDISGTTAYDRSGNSNDGTISGATVTPGKRGQALSFNGTSSNISIGDISNSLSSVSFWVKPSTTSQYLMDFDGGSHYLRINSGTITASGFSDPTIYVDGVASSTVSNTDWHYITVTTSTSFPASNVVLGRVSSDYLSGTLDEVRIYNRALSASEIGDLYRLGETRMNTSQITKNSDGLVLAQSFDGKYMDWSQSSAEARDASGNANHGDVSGATATIGKIGQALIFDGSDDYVNVAHSSSLMINDTLTVSLWMKANYSSQTGTYNRPISKGGSSGWELQRNDSSDGLILRIDTSGGSNQEVDNIPTVFDESWHFISFVLNSGNWATYKDGALSDSGTYDHGTGFSNANALQVGKRNTQNNYYLNGQVDEVRIYDRALSAEEIGDLYRMGQVKITK